MPPRRCTLIHWTPLGALLALLVALTPGALAAVLPAAGSTQHGWIALIPEDDNRAPGLYHFPAIIEPGGVRVGPRLLAAPTHLAAGADRVLIVYDEIASPPPAPQTTSNEKAAARRAEPQRRVQSITVSPGISTGYFQYLPVGRSPQSLPSLPNWGRLDGFTIAADVPLALISPAPTSPQPGAARTLYALRALEWVKTPLPDDLPADERPTLLADDLSVSLVARASPQTIAVWRSPIAPSRSPTDRTPPALDWSKEIIEAPATLDTFVLAAGQIVGVDVDAPGEVRLTVLRSSGPIDIDGAKDVAGDIAVFPVGERVYTVWTGADDNPRLHVAAVSAISGLTLFAGPAVTDPIVSGRELHTLALMLGFVLLTIMIFALRPDAAQRREVVLPEGWSLAGPARRALAVGIDLIPGLVIGAVVFDVRPGDMVSAALLSPDMLMRDAAALLLAIGLTVVHSTLGEWLTGCTIGKRIIGLRVVTVSGRPTLWQALARSALKFLCPPLALFVFLDAQARHPADVLTGSLVIRRAPQLPPPPEDDPR